MDTLLQAYLMPHPPIIIPAVGGRRAADAAATVAASRRVAREVAALKPETIIVVTPHGCRWPDRVIVSDSDRLGGDLRNFGAASTQLDLACDRALIAEFLSQAAAKRLPVRTDPRPPPLDHGAFIPLWWVYQERTDFQVVHLVAGFMHPATESAIGETLAASITVTGRRAVLIVSGDLSHCLAQDGPYGYTEAGRRLEDRMDSLMRAGDLAALDEFDPSWSEEAGQCGIGPLRIGRGALPADRVQPDVWSHEWPYGVGYMVARLLTPPNST